MFSFSTFHTQHLCSSDSLLFFPVNSYYLRMIICLGWWHELEERQNPSSICPLWRELGTWWVKVPLVLWSGFKHSLFAQFLYSQVIKLQNPRRLLNNLVLFSVPGIDWPPSWRHLCVEGGEGLDVVLECVQGEANQHLPVVIDLLPSSATLMIKHYLQLACCTFASSGQFRWGKME